MRASTELSRHGSRAPTPTSPGDLASGTWPAGARPDALFGFAVLDALPSAVVLADDAGRAVFANARAEEILGTQPGELVGTDVKELFVCDASAVEHRMSTVHERPDGERLTLGYSTSQVRAPNGATLRAVSFCDLSETVKLTAERDRLLQLAAVGEAMPTVLHEVRNPLSAIIATVELLLEDGPATPARDSLYAVLTEARRIALTLDGVGAVGRSLRAVRAAAIDMACRDICTVMSPRAEKVGVELKSDVVDLPLLPLDPSTTRALLLNLITNAIHACRPGDVIRVHVRLVRDGQDLEVSVVDTGTGMSAEVYAKCTELFFTTKRHGSGIGLALCRGAVEEAGGRIDIQSVPEVGTAVVLTVPVKKKKHETKSFTPSR